MFLLKIIANVRFIVAIETKIELWKKSGPVRQVQRFNNIAQKNILLWS